MSTFSQLKKSSTTQLDKLSDELSKLNQKPQFKNDSNDERFWKPSVDKAGNGSAIIRFLPAPPGEDVPFVRIWEHGFQGPGGWYIEKSLSTLGKPDPCGEYNAMLWASGSEANKEIVKQKQKRRLHFYSNIYVVKDPANPDNEGKVFLFKYGKKIFDRLNDLMNPEFEDEKKVNPFDLWNGVNFKLKIRKEGNFRNYDKSEFSEQCALLDSDEKLEKVWKSEYSLQELLDPKHFKTYDELKARLQRALMLNTATVGASTMGEDEDDLPVAAPRVQKEAAPADDEGLEYFKRLAAEAEED